MEQFIEKKLNGHKSMQATVKIYSSGKIELVSYYTTVLRAVILERTNNGIKYEIIPMGQFYDGERVFTPTTARHLSLFLSEYFEDVNYRTFKMCALDESYGIPVGTLRRTVDLYYGW